MNKHSNAYTFLYTAGLVLLVATALAVAAMGLKKRQQVNVEIEKKQAILMSVNKGNYLGNGKHAFIEELYTQYIVEQYVIGYDGEQKDGNAFNTNMKEQYDIIKQINTPSISDEQKVILRSQLLLPVYVFRNDDGELKYILPVYGLGLWGAIWGYVAFNDDFNTIYGAVFDHKAETPGLGAEIANTQFAHQFINKQIFDNGQFTSILLMKSGKSADNFHAVDAVSGGTITSRGVETMLKNCFTEYLPFFEKMKNAKIY